MAKKKLQETFLYSGKFVDNVPGSYGAGSLTGKPFDNSTLVFKSILILRL
jgi:hypothetical protein